MQRVKQMESTDYYRQISHKKIMFQKYKIKFQSWGLLLFMNYDSVKYIYIFTK